MESQQGWPEDKKITALFFWPENLEKYRSTEHYGAPLEGSTIFLCRSSTCRMSMESYRLAELNMQFSAGQDVRPKNYRTRSSFYQWSLSMGS